MLWHNLFSVHHFQTTTALPTHADAHWSQSTNPPGLPQTAPGRASTTESAIFELYRLPHGIYSLTISPPSLDHHHQPRVLAKYAEHDEQTNHFCGSANQSIRGRTSLANRKRPNDLAYHR